MNRTKSWLMLAGMLLVFLLGVWSLYPVEQPQPQQVTGMMPPMGWEAEQANKIEITPELGPPADLMGWAGEQAARDARMLLAQQLPPLEADFELVAESRGKEVRLWDFTKLVLRGKHLPTYRQQIGDCVSFGTANAIMYSSAVKIAVQGGRGEWQELYQPYIYGASRVLIGKGRIRGDGSTGSWAAAACQEYGVLSRVEQGCPEYSGSVAREWGRVGPPSKWVEIAKEHRPEARQVTSWEDAIASLSNGWAISVCSGQGFRMEAVERNGRLEGVPSGSWAHCVAFIAYDNRQGREAVYLLNSWGPNAHARSERYAALDGSPPGGFWVDRRTADRMLRQGDSYSYSFDGFRRQNIFPVLDQLKDNAHEHHRPGATLPDRAAVSGASVDGSFPGGSEPEPELPGRNQPFTDHFPDKLSRRLQVRELQVWPVRWSVRADACAATRVAQAHHHRVRRWSHLQLHRGPETCSRRASSVSRVCGSIV